ncbi:endonuclease/exonuclease/phosphatase family protein [Roseobacter sp. HKCCA0434]|uniref:endonuclease/exonuclease/phosphatase family protein n=1 Tax=Roseobacter sp. HKCCA0434 TaxID=3079297 RepID=UPI0029058869|nr:endonuclease/exonuclease/phosphatase family protein [Roseobacter sp. HKCCA0434]
MKFVRMCMTIAAAALLLAALAAYLGALHPAGDSFAALRLQLGLLALVLYAVSLPARAVLAERLAALAVIAQALPILATGWGARAPEGETITLLQHNVLLMHGDFLSLAAALESYDADILTLQEIGGPATSLLSLLSRAYPHVPDCPNASTTDAQIFSRFPLSDVTCGRTVMAATADTPIGRVRVASVHPFWPWPYAQSRSIAEIEDLLGDETLPVVMAGDFNNTAWSHAVTRVEAATGTHTVPGVRPTFGIEPASPFWPGLAIDHVLVPEGWGAEVTLLPKHGSDHRALLARIGP